MTKPKLSDALKTTPAATDTGTDPDAVVAASLGSDTGDAADTGDASATDDSAAADGDTDSDAGDAQPAAAAALLVTSTVNSTASLEQFREVFGHAEGSALYLDSTDFSAACVSHIGELRAQLTKATGQIDELRAQNKDLAARALGAESPVDTHAGQSSSGGDTDAVSSFASGLLNQAKK